MPYLYLSALIVSLLFPYSASLAMDRVPQDTKPVVGWLEQIRIFPSGLLFEAKLDTGADVSSLSVTVKRIQGMPQTQKSSPKMERPGYVLPLRTVKGTKPF